MNKKLYLIHHGQIDSNPEKRYFGMTDLSISKEGIHQMRKVRNFLDDLEFQRIYASPLLRCVESANIIAHSDIGDPCKEVIVEDAFHEIDPDFFIPVGGEGFYQVAQRVLPALSKLIEKEEQDNIVLVANTGVNRVILSDLLHLPMKDLFHINQSHGCINEIHILDTQITWKYHRMR